MERRWRRMPVKWGPHWFCKELKDRDLAEFRRVNQVQHNCEPPFFSYKSFPDEPVKEDEGWWLPILDERMTAETEP